MELHYFSLYPNSNTVMFPTIKLNLPLSTHLLFTKHTLYPSSRSRRRRRVLSSLSAEIIGSPEHPGGKMVAELVGAFNHLTHRMNAASLSTSSSRLLFQTLKLSIPLLQPLPPSPDGRSHLSKALSLALILADLEMDAEVISTGILRQALDAGAISIYEVNDRIGTAIAHLLHETLRLNNISSRVQFLDNGNSTALRKFCLTYYDVRALILTLVLKLDTMRHLGYLPRYRQQMLSMEVMKIHAPLAHAVGMNLLSLELEDLSLQYLFPFSYLYLDAWLRSHETISKPQIDVYKEQLLHSLTSDPVLAEMVDRISVEGRYKSRYSTMKKLLRDGRKLEEVTDILGLRVILSPASGKSESEAGLKACYRTREIVRSLWQETPTRSKDYIARPKANGYKSLHMAVDVSENGFNRPLMEIQIRTSEMDMLAAGGAASHSLYKCGLTDPEESRRLKAIMMATAELAAFRLKDLPSENPNGLGVDNRDRVFCLLDKNGDGKISIEELMEVMEELGAQGEDAGEMMQLLDSNNDGSLSSDEFDLFQKQIGLMQNLEYGDKPKLYEKLQMTEKQ